VVAFRIPPTRKQFVPTVVDEITAERFRRWLTESIEVVEEFAKTKAAILNDNQ